MSNLQIWEEKIKAKRMKTPFRDFVREIMSYYTINLYKKDGLISAFPPKSPYGVVTTQEFEERRSDYGKLGKDYDFSLGFWSNFMELTKKVVYPSIATWGNNENSDFAHKIMNGNNCYLSFEVCDSDTVLYSVNVKDHCRDIYNSIMIGDHSEMVYQSVGIYQSSKVFYSKFIFNSNNVWFSTNLIGCTECMLCNNLENQSYCINNQPYPKEEYLKRKSEILADKDKYMEYCNRLDVGKGQLLSTDSKGKFLIKTNNVENGYFIYNIQGGRNAMFAGTAEGNRNFFDAASCGAPRWDNYYGVVGAGWGDNYYCGIEIIGWMNNYYSYFLDDCSFCLGCVWLKNKSYCILNKQYTKEEWYELADKIFAKMDQDGILGDFFPWSLNPFYFNDTIACLIYDTFTKEEVMKEGYMWREEKVQADIPERADIIETTDLGKYQGFYDSKKEDPETSSGWREWYIDPEILKKVIRDEKGNFYKIVPMEFEFLRKHSLPLPEIHWLERIKMGFRM